MKWSLTGGGRLREVVAMRELTAYPVYMKTKTIEVVILRPTPKIPAAREKNLRYPGY